MARSLLLVAALGLLCITAVRAQADDNLPADELKGNWDSIIDVLDSKNGTTALGDLILSLAANTTLVPAALVDALSSNSTVATVFAPTDEAIEAVSSVLETLTDEEKLAIILYHVVLGDALTLADIRMMDNELLTTAYPGDETEGKLKVHVPVGSSKAALKTTSGQTVPIYQYNIKAGSAVIHTVKNVLIPGNKTLHAGGAETPSPAPSMS